MQKPGGHRVPYTRRGLETNRFRDPRYRPWRLEVLRRCRYACQGCGKRASPSGAGLDCHHLKSWAHFPNLRFDPANGTALCRGCHKREHARQRALARPRSDARRRR